MQANEKHHKEISEEVKSVQLEKSGVNVKGLRINQVIKDTSMLNRVQINDEKRKENTRWTS